MFGLETRRTRVIWASASVVLILGVLVSLMQTGSAQRRRDEQATRRAEATAEGVLLPLLSSSDLARPITGSRYDTLSGQIGPAIVEAGPTGEVKVWKLDGTILFSTVEKEVGTKLPGFADHLSAVSSDGTGSVVEDGRFRTFVPLKKSGVPIVAELDEPYGPIWSGANWPWRTLAFVLGFASLIAIGLLAVSFRPVRPQARTPVAEPAPTPPAPAASPGPSIRPAVQRPAAADPPEAVDAGSRSAAAHPDLAAEVEARRKAEERILDAEGRAERAAAELELLQEQAKKVDADREEAVREREAMREELARLRAQLVRQEREKATVDPAAVEQAEARARQAEELAQEQVRLAQERAALAEATIEEATREAAERAAAAEAELEALRASAGAAEAELASLRSTVEATQTEMAGLSAELNEAREQVRRLDAEAEARTRSALEETEAVAQDAVARAEEAETRARAAEERAADTARSLDELRSKDGVVEEEMQRLRQMLNAAESKAEAAEARRGELEQVEAEREAQLAALRAQVTELQSQLAAKSADADAAGRLETAEQRAAEAERRAAEAEERAGRAEEDLIAFQLESGAEGDRSALEESLATAEARVREAEERLQESADRETEFQREVARLHAELEEARSSPGGDPGAAQRAAELEEQLAMVRSRLETTEELAARLERELKARDSISLSSANGDGSDLEQMLRISQERLASSAEALQRAEERAFEAEKEVKRLQALEAEAEARFRQGKLEETLRGKRAPEGAAGEGPAFEDRRASSPFMAALALDAKNSLTSILGLTMTLKHKDATPEQQELIRRLGQQTRRLDHLVADLLEADRLAHGDVELLRRRTNLDALLRRIVDESGLAAERQITILSESTTASVSAPRVEQIVSTLLATVRERTTDGGKIWVRLDRTDGGVLLSVEDEHPSSDAAMSPVVLRFADLHGGWARVESRESGGSAFRVFLADEDADTPAEGSPDASEVDLVEDKAQEIQAAPPGS